MRMLAMQTETTDLSSLSTPAALEFECQVETLVAGGVPWTAGLTDEQFRALVAPLAERAVALSSDDGRRERPPARIPFTLVVAPELLPAERAVALLQRRGDRAAGALAEARDEQLVAIPRGVAYLLADVVAGGAVPPGSGRSPLTAEERLAVTIQAAWAGAGATMPPAATCGARIGL
ncbi:DUF5701 family protein [Conexibacter sp. JD483]|uniref:DUF5701 family protein n=1 Tax=unclassified Conexibacter TaxID=2627773 RepID=UPI0027176457|nr:MULTISPECIES: DUF5701 family protein [unclassified Conexibacter]MDO8187139.1 DUF5701 family protein [Conexibacter sp. CPCC 205706]MDO8200315.1 DUF5701 family protein [Conexibacter sp. CPCC 205762]MDR9368889.1 DUF5701 family protein [Conexibacter sp. JD483]